MLHLYVQHDLSLYLTMKIKPFIYSLLFITANAFGQNESAKTMNLNEVIISANKIEELKKNVAQEAEVFTDSAITILQPQSTAELFSSSAEIFVQKSQQGGGSPVLRGFEANRVLLMIDGVRMNNLIYRGGHLQNIITVDEQLLDRAEVLYGPASTIYGSDALGGVVHFYTRKPEFSNDSSLKFSIRASQRFSSVNNELTSHVDFSLGGKKLASLTSFSRSDFGDLRSGRNQNPFYTSSFGERNFYIKRINGTDSIVTNPDKNIQVQSGYTQYDVVQKFSYAANANTKHDINLQFSTSTDVPRYDRLTDTQNGTLRFSEWYYGPQERLMAAYDFSHLYEGKFLKRLHAGINYQSIEESRHTRRYKNALLQHRIENVGVTGFSIDAQGGNAKHDLRVGIDGQYNTLKSTASNENIETRLSSPLDTRYPGGKNNMLYSGLYISHAWQINEQLRFTDGARIGLTSLNAEFSDTTFFKFPFTQAKQTNVVYSGNIGLIHIADDGTKLSALISSGFRAPNVDDLAKVFESTGGRLIVPNNNLKPEKTITYEIGVNQFNGKSGVEFVTYYTDLYDAIVTDAFTYNGKDSIDYNGQLSAVYANQNKRRAYIYGVAGKFLFNQDKAIKGEFSAAYTYGRIKTDSSDHPLDHIAPFNSRLQFSYHQKKFTSLLYIQMNGWKRLKDYNSGGEDNLQYATADGMPGWFTLNIKTAYQLTKEFSLQCGIENVFDTQYRTFSSGINAPGRNIYVNLSWKL